MEEAAAFLGMLGDVLGKLFGLATQYPTATVTILIGIVAAVLWGMKRTGLAVVLFIVDALIIAGALGVDFGSLGSGS